MVMGRRSTKHFPVRLRLCPRQDRTEVNHECTRMDTDPEQSTQTILILDFAVQSNHGLQ